MLKGELVVVDDVADSFASLVIERFGDRERERFAVALSGGDTARLCYRALAQRRGEIDWSFVDVWWGDERCVPPSDPASNARLAREALLDHVPVGSEHPMVCGTEGADDYDAALRAVPPLDLIHLGLGPDGHTASLFPGSTALTAPPDRLVVANIDPTGRNALARLTLTYAGIARGRTVVVTVAGAGKADALSRVRNGDPSAPASAVDAANVTWLVDHAAVDGTGPSGHSTGPR